jgi:hypothetical protein
MNSLRLVGQDSILLSPCYGQPFSLTCLDLLSNGSFDILRCIAVNKDISKTKLVEDIQHNLHLILCGAEEQGAKTGGDMSSSNDRLVIYPT